MKLDNEAGTSTSNICVVVWCHSEEYTAQATYHILELFKNVNLFKTSKQAANHQASSDVQLDARINTKRQLLYCKERFY